MEHNFKCECGKQFCIPVFKIIFKTSGKLYRDNHENELKCDCGKSLIEIPHDGKLEMPFIGKYSSMNAEQKRAVLKQRSSDHYNREIKDVQHQMHKDTFNSLLQS